MNECKICPRNCKVNRTIGEKGFCQAPAHLVIAKYSLHAGEEPCISGTNGSGTIFFSYCNLKCLFCQNYQISTLNYGKKVTIEEFANICLELQKLNAHNINLVSPTIYALLIKEGLILAKQQGLTIPIIYNTSGYETVDTIKSFNGLIDIYLPDLKYFDDTLAIKYSKTPNYFHHASLAIQEMYNQTGMPVFDKDGLLKKGVIVRYLVMPTHLNDSKKIINYLYKTYKNKIYLSIMNQYTPVSHYKYEELNHPLKEKDYEKIIDYAYNLGIRQAFVQEKNTSTTTFIPDFSTFAPSK